MAESKTHFEQVPLKVVKEILERQNHAEKREGEAQEPKDEALKALGR
jgi:hypothetical protein